MYTWVDTISYLSGQRLNSQILRVTNENNLEFNLWFNDNEKTESFSLIQFDGEVNIVLPNPTLAHPTV